MHNAKISGKKLHHRRTGHEPRPQTDTRYLRGPAPAPAPPLNRTRPATPAPCRRCCRLFRPRPPRTHQTNKADVKTPIATPPDPTQQKRGSRTKRNPHKRRNGLSISGHLSAAGSTQPGTGWPGLIDRELSAGIRAQSGNKSTAVARSRTYRTPSRAQQKRGGPPTKGRSPPQKRCPAATYSPTPHHGGSTISAGRLNDRVRNETGCFPSAITAVTLNPTTSRTPPAGETYKGHNNATI